MAKKGRLEGKVAIITGAGRGIGREYALAFAREGAKVAVNDLGGSLQGRGESRGPADEVVAEIEALGGEAISSYADVANHEEAARSVDETLAAFGRVDVLVNNAAVSRRGPLLELDEEGWDLTIDTHLKGSFNFIRHAAPHMLAQGSGSIINTTSGAAFIPTARSGVYAAAKGGVLSLMMSLSVEFAPQQVRVNCVSPGLTATRLGNTAFEDMQQAFGLSETELVEQIGAPQSPAALAPLAIFLASDASREISGRTFEVVGESIHLVSAPTRSRTFVKPGGWSAEDFFDAFPRRFEG